MARSDDATGGNGSGVERRLSTATLSPRMIFFGMNCGFSLPPLRACLAAGYDIRAVVVPGRSLEASPIATIAAANAVPLLPFRDLRDVATLAAFQPELIVVACFPHRLPEALLALPRLGCLNVHPSLLPLGRGPEPIFWTLRRGERRTGVTIHLMDEGLDTGPILTQSGLDIAPGIRAPALEATLAHLGGQLLVATIATLQAGQAHPQPQNAETATAASFPSAADWLVPTNLPATWAYNFVRGVAPLDGPLTLRVTRGGACFPLSDALDVDPTGSLAAPIVLDGASLWAQFNSGTVRFQLPPSPGGKV
ncbi:MAG: methionyl-tRNA formyltransferase [Chloroflexota bacterium]|nr:methionyl-tRNA formyltransferase [Chloroflexota bacterium]